MKLIKLLILFLSLEVKGSDGLKNEARMILDVILYYHNPTAVLAKLCWRFSDKMKLAKMVMQTDRAKSIQFINNISDITKFAGDDMIIVLDLNCRDSKYFLEKASKNNKFGNPYRWMLLSDRVENNIVAMSELKEISILIDSEVMVACKSRDGVTFLYKTYKFDTTSDFIIEIFGMWTVDRGLTVTEEAKIPTPVRRKNLRGRRIVISVVITEDATKTEIYSLNDIVTDHISKMSFHNILPLYAYINATPQLLFTDTWGYYVNGSWNGMIGQVLRGKADILGSVLTMQEKRAEILSYLTQPIPFVARFVFRQPPLSFQNNLFYLPFRSTVWISFGALILVLIFVIYFTARWEVVKNGTKGDDPKILRPNISDIAIFVAGAVVQQGGINELKSSLGKLVTFIMFLVFLFLYTSYSAYIVALLQSSSDQIRTLADLLASKLELGVEDTPYARYYFATASDRVRKAINAKVVRTGYKPNFMTVEEGVQKLRNADVPFAFHMNTGLGYRFVEHYFYEHEKCGLREIEYLVVGVPWVACRKLSPYKEIYKIGMVRVWEHGIGSRINRLLFTRKPSCTSRGGSFGSVNMTDFHPVLLCLLYGMIASILLLGLEILVHKRQAFKARMQPETCGASLMRTP